MLADPAADATRRTPAAVARGLAQKEDVPGSTWHLLPWRHMTPDHTDRGIPLSVRADNARGPRTA